MTDLKLSAEIWEMREGKTTAVNIDDKIFRLDTSDVKSPKSFSYLKETYLSKWIKENSIQVFTLEDFYKAYPRQRDRKRHVDKYISEMIADNKLLQIGKDKFKVTENMQDE